MLSVLGSLFGSASKLVGLGVPSDDGFVDRLNHNWTTFLLTLFSLVVTTTQFAGHPIRCWIQKELDDHSWPDYIHNLCWIKNTYAAPFPAPLPGPEKERRMNEIKYYQWVPLILLCQALMFKLPNVVWQVLNGKVGLNMKKIITLAASTQYDDPKDRDTTIKNIAAYINSWLLFERERHYTVFSRFRHRMSRLKILCFPLGIRNGTYLVGLYLFTKLLYFANVVGQFYVLAKFMDFDFQNYGFDFIWYLNADSGLKESPRFPRVTYCDVMIRQLQNVNTYTFQCVLSINMLSERIFAALWFWLFLLACANGLSVLKWIYSVVFRRNRVRYVEKYLSDFVNVAEEQELCQRFVDDYLRDDGVFVLRAVSNNSSMIVLADLVRELWDLYRKGSLCEPQEARKRKKKQKEAMDMEVVHDGNGQTTTHLRKFATHAL